MPQSMATSVGGPQPLSARQGRHRQRYGDNGARLVAGCIPIRFSRADGGAEVVEVLLVSSRGKDAAGVGKAVDGKGFCFPKGGWEDDESVESAAKRETVEEAGVRGSLEEPMLGPFPFTSCKATSRNTLHQGKCLAHMFVMHVVEELEIWPEGHERQRFWVPLSEARAKCRYDWMVHALDSLSKHQALGSFTQRRGTDCALLQNADCTLQSTDCITASTDCITASTKPTLLKWDSPANVHDWNSSTESEQQNIRA